VEKSGNVLRRNLGRKGNTLLKSFDRIKQKQGLNFVLGYTAGLGNLILSEKMNV
jgi:hypothetical protein